MKKTLALVLILTLITLFSVSCAPAPDETVINIGYMSGPTGMGMAKLIADNGGVEGNEDYTFTSFDNTTLAVQKLMNKDVDIICIPTNEAANLYKDNKDLSVLAINTLGTLFLVTNENHTITSLEDLNGKTIYTCKNGTPRVILENLIEAYGIDATVSYTIGETEMAAPKDLAAQVMAGKIDIAVAPEPIVTNIISKNANFSVDLDLADYWMNKYDSPLTMGCIVTRKDFIAEHKTILDEFLNEYEASIAYISNSNNVSTSAQYVTDAGILDDANKASLSLQNLGDAISYIDGSEMKSALASFYSVIGIALPDDAFYYVG